MANQSDLIYQLIYVSITDLNWSEETLNHLLTKAREKNRSIKVTGMLAYKSGFFAQCLEGPEEAVRNLYELISKDSRHKRINLIYERRVLERSFPDWSMAFQAVNDADLDMVNAILDLKKSASERNALEDKAIKLMHQFKKAI